MKRYLSVPGAIPISSLLHGLAIGLGGFIPDIFAAVAAGIFLGSVYE
jgi:hypothetical protein